MCLHGTMLLDLAREVKYLLSLSIPVSHLPSPIHCHRSPVFSSLPYETRHRLNQRPLNIHVPILPNKVPRYTVRAAMLDPNLMGQPSVSACSRLHTVVILPIRRPWKSWPMHGICRLYRFGRGDEVGTMLGQWSGRGGRRRRIR